MKISPIVAIVTIGILGVTVYSLFSSRQGGAINQYKTIPVESTSTPEPPITIEIVSTGLVPKELTIKSGSGVVFKNLDSEPHWPAAGDHPTHDAYPEFDSKHEIKPGEEWGFVFEKLGTWEVHDHLTEQSLGTITVINN